MLKITTVFAVYTNTAPGADLLRPLYMSHSFLSDA